MTCQVKLLVRLCQACNDNNKGAMRGKGEVMLLFTKGDGVVVYGHKRCVRLGHQLESAVLKRPNTT